MASKVRSLSSAELVRRLEELNALERSQAFEFVLLLAEMGRREHHTELGFSSLFAYCCEGLGLEKSYAYRRSTAARLVLRFPACVAYLKDGRLSVTTLVALRKALKPESHLRLLDAASGLSENQVKRLVAAEDPRARPRDVVRRLPTRIVEISDLVSVLKPAEAAVPASAPAQTVASANPGATPTPVDAQQHSVSVLKPAEQVTPTGTAPLAVSVLKPAEQATSTGAAPLAVSVLRPAEQVTSTGAAPLAVSVLKPAEPPAAVGAAPTASSVELFSTTVVMPPPAPKFVPLDAEYSRVAFSADAEFIELLNQTRAALSHVVPDGNLQDVFRESLRLALESVTRRRASAQHPKAPQPREPEAAHAAAANAPPVSALKPAAAPDSRYIPAEVRAEVWARDGGRCSFVGSTGRVCGSDWQVQFAHRRSFVTGGSNTVENIRLACRQHNLFEAIREFGPDHMRQFAFVPDSDRMDESSAPSLPDEGPAHTASAG